MSFLNPIGLIGLLSLPVILALHLLRRKQRPYVVSHLGLWTFLEQQTRGPRARRIPLTWILLLDLLLGALLSLAWSRPSIALAQPGHAPRHTIILLDVSSSMRAEEGASSRFEQAKATADTLLREASAKDAVTVVTFGQRAQVIADSRQGIIASTGSAQENPQIDLARLSGQLNDVQVGETGHSLAEALALGQGALDPELPAEFHVITDGAFPLPDSQAVGRFAYPIRWHWVGGAAGNQAVLELNATPLGGDQLQIFARFANFGSQPVIRQALVAIDGRVVNQTAVTIPAGSTVPQVWQVSPGQPAGSVLVTLSGSGDALAEDNSAAIGLQPGGQIRVALVTETPAPIQQAIQAIPDVDLHVIAPANYASALASEPMPFDLTIFRGFLPDQWPAGQVLVVDPPAQGSPTGTNQLTGGPARPIPAGSLTQAAEASPLVAGIDFSGVRWARAGTLDGSPSGLTSLLQANGVPILLQGQAGQTANPSGSLTILLADLNQGNFARHPAFPILMANLVELSRQAPIPPGFQTGQTLPMPAEGSYRAVRITPPEGDPVNLSSWPEQWTDTLEPGLYRFQLTGADGSTSEFSAGARAGDLIESDLNPRGWAQTIAAAQDEQAANAAENTEQNLDLRPWLLGAALLVFLLEAFLAWRR